MTEPAERTPGQIGYDAWYIDAGYRPMGYQKETSVVRRVWETTAQAVRQPLLDRIAELEARIEAVKNVQRYVTTTYSWWEEGHEHIESSTQEDPNGGLCVYDDLILALEGNLDPPIGDKR